MIRQTIETAITKALEKSGATGVSFVVERPSSMEHGDYATNAALAAEKMLKKNPREVAELLVSSLGIIEGVEKMEVAGAGFINFYLSRATLLAVLEEKDSTTVSTPHTGKTVMVEYTQPNPFKPFHIGHLMSNTMGEAIAKLLEASGAKVVRANYQGDVGPHVAKALYVLLRQGNTQPSIEEIGAAYAEGHRLSEEDPSAKTEIDELNKKIYDRTDESVNALYEYGRKLSLMHFEELYQMLGTKFDHYYFESETAPVGIEIVRAHPTIFTESDGAIVFKGEEYGLHTRVFITSKGLPTYEAKELGLAKTKQEQVPFDESITVTASEQDGYFKVMLKAIELSIPSLAGKLSHRSHGMMRFADGKMSSRKGNVVTGESLLMDLKAAAKEKMQERTLENPEAVAQDIAVSAIKYAVLRQGSGKDIVFDPEKSLSLEGDSGPYIQYALVRARSLLRGAEAAGVEGRNDDAPLTATALERILLHYPQALSRAAEELEPHHLTTYITELAAAFNAWYASGKVIGGTNPHYGVLLTKVVERTLLQGISTLGIPTPKEM